MPKLRQPAPATKALREAPARSSTARGRVALFGPTAFGPEFDLLAAASEDDRFDGGTEPLSLYSVPRYIKVAVKRVQRDADLAGVKLPKSKIVGAALDYGLQRLRGAAESQVFLGVLEAAESSTDLSLSDELVLDEAIESFKFTPRDPNSGYERWTVRVPEQVKEGCYGTQALLRIPVSALASACLGRGLAGQPGVNPEASELMKETFAQLRASLKARAAHLEKLVALLEDDE